jgi:NAD kinase
MTYEYAILVKNKTRLESLIERFNTKAQAQFYIERSGGNFSDYEQEHAVFHESFSLVQRQLGRLIKNKIVERAFVPSFLFDKKQMVVVVGQDGLVANTAKYAQGLPIVAINPDLERYDGQLLPYHTGNFLQAIEQVLANRHQVRQLSFAEATLHDGQRLLGFNDLFIGAASHVSARYTIAFNEVQESHSSSGVIVSTKAGSTGWLSSVFNMAGGLADFMGLAGERPFVSLHDRELLFVVREPFVSKQSQAGITVGVVSKDKKLVLESRMPVNGIIFSDGVEADFLRFNAGAIASIGVAEERAHLVVPGPITAG